MKAIEAKNYDFRKHGVTQSLLAHNDGCPYRAKLMLLGYARPGSTSPAILYGDCVHYILRYADSYKDVSELAETWKIHRIKKGENIDECSLVAVKAATVMLEYYGYWHADDVGVEKKYTEKEFDIPYEVGTLKTRLRGRYDGFREVGQRRRKKLYLLENKTKATIEEQLIIDMLPYDFQTLFYAFAASIEFKCTISGVVYNVIRNPRDPKKKETYDSYADRIQDDIASRPEFYFMRFVSPFNKTTLNEFEVRLQRKIFQFCTTHLSSLEFADQRTCSCVTRFRCEFIKFCSGFPDMYIQNRKLFVELEE